MLCSRVRKVFTNRSSRVFLAALILLPLASCSSTESSSSEADALRAEIDAQVAGDSDSGANPFGGNDPEDSLMPNVLCMNLQEAQNEIQDHGVFYSRSVDATGQDRMQIRDSNWIVVGQRPSPGTPIGEGDAVLSVVKIGENTGGKC